MNPSGPTGALFILLVLVMAGLVFAAIYRVTRQTDQSALLLSIGGAVVYLVLPALAARSGLVGEYTPFPRPLLLVVAVTAVTILVAFSSLGGKLATGLGLAVLVGFQAFRIPVELLLHRLFEEGTIPEVMTYSGRNFDILTGVTAAILGLVLLRRRLPDRLVLVWNVIGLLLLANIVVIAALASPVRFQVFTDGPPNLLPSTFPYVWLPTFLVQLALLGHLLVFRRLRSATPTRT